MNIKSDEMLSEIDNVFDNWQFNHVSIMCLEFSFSYIPASPRNNVT